jgi:uncharacterized protein with PIN domain
MKPRFLVDVNVGRIAKWLRVIGYDALYIPDADDGELVRVAGEQDRIILTRDRYIAERRAVASGKVRVLLLRSHDFREQMREVTEALDLGFHDGFSICIECNAPLQEIDKESVRDRVPDFVFSTQDSFQVCPYCGKLYWRGTHWHNMKAEIGRFKGDG